MYVLDELRAETSHCNMLTAIVPFTPDLPFFNLGMYLVLGVWQPHGASVCTDSKVTAEPEVKRNCWYNEYDGLMMFMVLGHWRPVASVMDRRIYW